MQPSPSADEAPSPLSQYLYDARVACGLNVRQAARAIGISHSRVLDFEAGFDMHTRRPCTPALPTLLRIAEAYGLDVAELLEHAGYSVPALAKGAEERSLLDGFRALSANGKAALLSKLTDLRETHTSSGEI